MNATSAPVPEPQDSGDDLKLVLPGRSNAAGAGWEWIAGGWRIFMRAPLMWIIAMIIILFATVVIGLVPFLGSLAVQLLQPVIGAGLIVASHSLERGGEFELEHLFAGFRKNFGNLVVVGLLFLLGGIVIVGIFIAFVGFSVGTAFLTGDPNAIFTTVMGSAMIIVLGLLVMMALLLPLVAAYWFAPALVMMHDVAPMAAMRESFLACFRNFVPFLVYGVIVFVLAILAAIPFGLGFLVLVPVIMASIYVSYRQVFTEETAPVSSPPSS